MREDVAFGMESHSDTMLYASEYIFDPSRQLTGLLRPTDCYSQMMLMLELGPLNLNITLGASRLRFESVFSNHARTRPSYCCLLL